MVHHIDDFVMDHLKQIEGKKFVTPKKEPLVIDDYEGNSNKTIDEMNVECGAIVKLMNEVLSDRVDEVIVSSGLGNLVCRLMTYKYTWSASIERTMIARALRHKFHDKLAIFDLISEYAMPHTTMVINPFHPIFSGHVGRPCFSCAASGRCERLCDVCKQTRMSSLKKKLDVGEADETIHDLA